jgi:hypothetical protein
MDPWHPSLEATRLLDQGQGEVWFDLSWAGIDGTVVASLGQGAAAM